MRQGQRVSGVAAEVLQTARAKAADIAAIGITNQRETTVAWDKRTGKAIAKAIVWQDRRTAEFCGALRAAGHEAAVQAKTGLLLDPYFSASKMGWLLANAPPVREAADAAEAARATELSREWAFRSQALNAATSLERQRIAVIGQIAEVMLRPRPRDR